METKKAEDGDGSSLARLATLLFPCDTGKQILLVEREEQALEEAFEILEQLRREGAVLLPLPAK